MAPIRLAVVGERLPPVQDFMRFLSCTVGLFAMIGKSVFVGPYHEGSVRSRHLVSRWHWMFLEAD